MSADETIEGPSRAVVRSGSRAPAHRLPRYLAIRRRSSSRVFLVFTALLGGAVPFLGEWGFLPLFGVTGVLIVQVIRQLSASRSWGTTYMDADAHLRALELEAAEALITAMAKRIRSVPIQHVISVHMLAVIARLRGDIVRARACIEEVLASGWLDGKSSGLAFHRPDVLGECALLLAIDGELDAAERRLAEARASLSPVRGAVISLPTALIRARRGEWNACIEHIETDRDRARGLLRPHDGRALAVVEAFALLHADAGAAGYRAGARERRVEDALAEARPVRAGEFDYLGHAWPAMRQFLAAHVGAPRPARSPP